MSLASRCSFCVKLPSTANRRAGRSSKCPLCKGELVIAPNSEVIYRLETADEALPRRGGTRRLLVAGLGSILVVSSLLAAWALTRPGAPSPRTGQTTPLAETAVTHSDGPRSVRTSPWDNRVAVPERLPAPAHEEVAATVPPHGTASQRTDGPVWEKIRPPAVAAEVSPGRVPDQPTAVKLPTGFGGRYGSEEDLLLLLAEVPELDLEQAKKPATVRLAKQQIAKLAETIRRQTKSDPDAFVNGLIAKRADLAGLPFLKGKTCRLPTDEAKALQTMSITVRRALAGAARSSFSSAGRTVVLPADPNRFWQCFSRTPGKTVLRKRDLATLRQMLQPEHLGMRLSWVAYLKRCTDRAASVELARLAVFDLTFAVRYEALTALKDRPAEEYSAVLLKALRHPWAPVVDHAAEAVVALKLKSAVPAVIAMLDAPDPDAPFLTKEKDRKVPVVRELVRINHLRNCMLCHAPSFARSDLVRGPVPTPGERIPSLADRYYAERSGAALVRADVTYLRQDFSLMQPVKDHGVWPAQQRYDFLVRTRPLTEAERAAWEARKGQPGVAQMSAHKQILLTILHELTGEHAGPASEEWRQLLRVTEELRGALSDPALRIGWKRPCFR